MIPSPFRRENFLAALAGACLLPAVSTAATTVVGTGADLSYLVLQSPALGERTFEVHYTYSPGGSQDAYFLLGQVIAGDPPYSVSFVNFGSPDAPNYFVDSINGETGTALPPYLYWVHWVAGGTGFQNPDYSYNSGAVADGSWSIGYGISTHFVEPGSWDALVYSDGSTPPSVAPVPEISSALLGLAGSLVFLKRRRG